jgi:hypothetical protein
VPPLNTAWLHVKVTEVAVRDVIVSCSEIGASGLVKIIAPLPTLDGFECPYKL